MRCLQGLVLCAVLSISAPATAALTSISWLFDANSFVPADAAQTDVVRLSPLDHPLDINAGDTVELTINFLHGQALQLTYPFGLISAGILNSANTGGGPIFTGYNYRLEFVDFSGPASSTYSSGVNCTDACLVGDWFGFDSLDDPNDASSTISFTGIKLTFTDIAYHDAAGNALPSSQRFDLGGVGLQAIKYTVIDSQTLTVDEPASLPLISLAVATMFMRTRRSRL